MVGINVLSDTIKGGNKLEKTSTLKGKDVAVSPENIAAVFASMLCGSMNSNADPNGQNLSITGQESEEKQSVGKPVQSVQNPNGQGRMLGYGNFSLPFLTQLRLQTDLPEGKEANSRHDVSQGTEGLATANASLTNAQIVVGNNLELASLNLVSLASDETSVQSGMMTQKSQGDNPGMTELDKYRQVIADLLVALSGEIKVPPPKGNILSSESAGAKGLSQDMAKIVQGWALTDDVVKDGNAILNTKFSMLQAAFPNERLQGEDLKESKQRDEPLRAEGNGADNIFRGHLKAFSKSIKGMEDDLLSRKVQSVFSKDSPKEIESAKPFETLVAKAPQNQYLSTGMESVGNVISVNSAATKTAAIPVWQQISDAFREQVLHRHQELKELDIQLHPADLGKIQITLRWENGQVHLQVQASEASTGQVLQNHISDLRQSLSNEGVDCGMLQMGQGGGERQQNSRGNDSHKTVSQNTHPNEEDPIIAINPLSLGQDEIVRINVTA